MHKRSLLSKLPTPLERAANLKVDHFNTRSLVISHEREGVPVDNKNTQEEAGDAEDGNPSGGDPIASLVRSGQTHSSISKKAFSFIRKRTRYKEKKGTPLEKEHRLYRTRRKSDDVQNHLGNEWGCHL